MRIALFIFIAGIALPLAGCATSSTGTDAYEQAAVSQDAQNFRWIIPASEPPATYVIPARVVDWHSASSPVNRIARSVDNSVVNYAPPAPRYYMPVTSREYAVPLRTTFYPQVPPAAVSTKVLGTAAENAVAASPNDAGSSARSAEKNAGFVTGPAPDDNDVASLHGQTNSIYRRLASKAPEYRHHVTEMVERLLNDSPSAAGDKVGTPDDQ